MIRSTLLTALTALTVALVLTVRIEEGRLNAERTRTAQLALHATNLAAERDSTRAVAVELGDSLRIVEKQVLQVAQRSDALDKALGRERIARYIMKGAVDSLERVAFVTPAADSTDTIRRARFDVRQPPYTISANVEIPQPPDSARLSLRVALDPIHVEARVTCSPPNGDGIRTASVVAAAPSWATVRFDRLEQSPELCASPALVRSAQSRRAFGFAPLLVGAGRVFNAGQPARWGIFVGTGFTFWS
jgi:hypothetical protein